jgi:hypothetical protein
MVLSSLKSGVTPTETKTDNPDKTDTQMYFHRDLLVFALFATGEQKHVPTNLQGSKNKSTTTACLIRRTDG